MPDRLFIDTNILIDFLRGRPMAEGFIRGLSSRPFLSAITVAELFAGVHDGEEREQLDRLIGGFRTIGVTAPIAVAGGLYVRQYRKSHNVGLADALIAATVAADDAILATLNQKHFPMLSKLVVPYGTK